LNPIEKPEMTDEGMSELRMKQDVLHANSISVLSKDMASQFPDFKAGQVLLSIRSLNALAAMDPTNGSIVWGVRGPWNHQHDAQFLDNGRILLFDNKGSQRGSRVLEYDPRDKSFPWSYWGGDNYSFFTSERGMAQRLPNGNTLIVISEEKEMIEVTQSKEVVWTCLANSFISTARRYGPDQLSFLKPDQRPRGNK
jgi:hypothetical protein